MACFVYRVAEAGGVKETIICYLQLLGLEWPGAFRDPEPSCRNTFAAWQQSKQKNLPWQNYCKSLPFIAFAIRFHCISFPACVHAVVFYVSLASQQNNWPVCQCCWVIRPIHSLNTQTEASPSPPPSHGCWGVVLWVCCSQHQAAEAPAPAPVPADALCGCGAACAAQPVQAACACRAWVGDRAHQLMVLENRTGCWNELLKSCK